MKTILLILLIALSFGCNYPKGDQSKPKFSIGETVNLNDISLPGTGYVPPLKIKSLSWSDGYETWFYDATDKRDTLYHHFIEYQLKK